MYFKCKTGKIGVQQLTCITAVESLYREQSMKCIVLNLDPLTFELKQSVTPQQADRLFANRIPQVIMGFTGKVEGGKLVIQKEETLTTDE